MHLQPEQFHVEQQNTPVEATTARWYCVMVAPDGFRRHTIGDADQAGGIAYEHEIERRLKVKGFDAFVPVAVHVLPPKGSRRKKVEVRTPLFRGYAFVKLASPVSRADWSSICNVDGVVRILSTTSGPSPVRMGLVEALQAAGEVREQPQAAKHFKARSLARVTNGPFANFIGLISRVQSSKRVHLLLRMMGGGEMQIVVPVSVLEPVDEANKKGARG